MPVLKKIITNDSDLGRVQDAIKTAYDGLVNVPFTQVQFVDVAFIASATDTTVPHSLGRTPQGFIVVDKNVASDVYRTSWTSSNLVLRASAISNVRLMLF
jgi:hypothetical protein